MARKKNTGTPIAEHEHADDSRLNIPTVEQQEALVEDEQAPPPAVFQRNPALDPQLVWKGKYPDEKRPGEGATLEVSSLPIYIQEVVRPVALLEDLRADGDADGQLDLFASKRRKLSDDQRFDFYQHEEDWQNRLILGDSLLVMTSLAEREGMRGKVQMIYMDPPYGIKFGSNWQTKTDERDVKDGDVDDVAKDPEQIKAFRDTWKDGVNSYLSYLRDRLILAGELLADSGSMFVQIGEENVHRVRVVMDEVFGSENFVSQIAFDTSGGQTSSAIAAAGDYVVWYAKNHENLKFRRLFLEKVAGEGASTGERYDQLDEQGKLFQLTSLTSQSIGREKGEGAACWFRVDMDGGAYRPNLQSRWKTNESGMARLKMAGRVAVAGKTIRYRRYLEDFSAYSITNSWHDTAGSPGKVYVVQTSVKVVQRCMLMSTDPGDLVLDPTCGSGTTAMVAEEWGRRWITCDTSRVSLAVARTRILATRLPYYLLADSDDGRAKDMALTGVQPPDERPQLDVRHGFVYKRVPHVTLKAIANNEEIETISSEWQPRLDESRVILNALLKKPLEDWQIPRVPDPVWPAEAQPLLDAWWKLCTDRQQAIDASIARRADTEFLYDQPYEDPKRVRVAGPFTVESLSPHRVLPAGGDLPDSEREGQAKRGDSRFVETVLSHLRKAGVQNGERKQRLEFERLDAFPGQWIHAIGEGKGGLRVAVCVGPQFGTVGKALIDEARKEAEAAKSVGVLVVCGMAFEPTLARDTSKDQDDGGFALTAAEKRPRIEVFPVRISPDLTLADRLKNTGAGNLFMVFGEPELRVDRQADGRYAVTLLGIDVYDPGSGIVRSGSADGDHKEDVACWMLDTAYDGRCFVVRHLYFPGKKDPYERLKKALKAEINPTAWESLRGTTSRPFVRPPSGTIAVKVINHYGDEVLKVWRLA